MLSIPMNGGNGGSELVWWQFRNPQKEGYKDTLEGTLIEIDIVQSTRPGQNGQGSVPQFFPDGNPMTEIRWVILDSVTGQPTAFNFKRGKNSEFLKALNQACPGVSDMGQLGGHYFRIHSPNGQYGLNNPRPFVVQDCGISNIPFEGVKDLVHQAPQQQVPQQMGYVQQPQQQPQGYNPGGYPNGPLPQQPPAAMAAKQGYQAAAPVAQPPVMQQPMPQQPMQQPVQQVPQQQVPQPPMPQQQAPQQAPVQQQPVQQAPQRNQSIGEIYDESIPF